MATSSIDFQQGPASPEMDRAQARLVAATAAKLEAETAEINHRTRRGWVDAFAKPILTGLLAAVVAGAATWNFGLESAVKLNELTEKARKELTDSEKKSSDRAAEAMAKANEAEGREKTAKQISERTIDSLRLELGRLQAAAPSKEAKAAIAQSANGVVKDPIDQPTPSSGWFAVVASTYSKQDAQGLVTRFSKLLSPQPIKVFNATDERGKSIYAITIGGRVTKSEATQAVNAARASHAAEDAFAWQSPRWTEADL